MTKKDITIQVYEEFAKKVKMKGECPMCDTNDWFMPTLPEQGLLAQAYAIINKRLLDE